MVNNTSGIWAFEILDYIGIILDNTGINGHQGHVKPVEFGHLKW